MEPRKRLKLAPGAGHMHPAAQAGTHVDPVCKMKVAADAPHRHEHAGTTYLFCCPHCLAKFRADPAAYLSPTGAPAKPPAAPQVSTGGLYTCPMHPEIVRPGPGTCPLCGMALEPMDVAAFADEEQAPDPELVDMRRRLWLAVAFTLPVVLLAMGDMLPGGLVSRWLAPRTRVLVELVLSLPVALWAAFPFYQRAVASVRHRSLNMFTLIGLGVAVAYGFSALAALVPGLFPPAFRGHDGTVPVYFESAAVIVTLVLLGQVLELRARAKTGSAIRSLLGLAAKTARRLEADGQDREVAIAEIKAGDRLRVRPGDRVPVDGIILDGNGTIDESMVTGEPLARRRGAGERVIGATVNENGSFVMRAERVGGDTLLARIVQLVAQAQRSRAPIQGLADRVAAYFVPAVIAIAIVTLVVWALVGPEPRLAHGLVNAVAVLIIACPCALGLATPMSIMVAMGRAAQAGVLFRNAAAIERLRAVDTLVLDKTGTLTEGRPRVVDTFTTGDIDGKELLRLCASLERGSEHPLATAVVKEAARQGLPLAEVRDFESHTGKGVTGKVGGRDVAIGNRALLETLTPAGPERDAVLARAEQARAQGQTALLVAIDGQPRGLLAVADPIKQNTPRALAELRAAGLHLVLLTGDHPATARAVAAALGIDDVFAEVLPDGKAAKVKELEAAGRRVAMAGDGINDAPALAAANVGIAMSTGTDIAIESADVTLLGGDLDGIVRARQLGAATMRNIKQNLFFAFIYNSLGVPIAAGLLYPVFGLLLSPMLAAAAMSVSSVSVIANALRLRGVRL